jgi:hypothetical protein
MVPKLTSYEEFWPYYVSEHSLPATRVLHFVGTALVLACVALGLIVSPWWLLAAPLAGYGFAWVGHFFFEHNRPATFKHPLWSFRGDFVMLRDVLTGRIRW